MTHAALTEGRVGPHRAITIENRHLRAVILPELGGRVWELEDRIRERQWIWHREDVPLVASPAGAVYDDVWAGGWEELFPNDAPAVFEGRRLPDHGEWWTTRWRSACSMGESDVRVSLLASTTTVRASCVKEFVLRHDSPELKVKYRIASGETEPVHFLFKQHLAVSITPCCRLLLPGGRVQVVDARFGNLLPVTGPFDWPRVVGADGAAVDLGDVPPRTSRAREFVYVSHLPAPWCGVEDRECGASIRMDFEAARLPYVWFFLSYGGWRDTYTAVLEPCTNIPKDLGEAVRLGRSARLEPRGEFATEVTVALGPSPEGVS